MALCEQARPTLTASLPMSAIRPRMDWPCPKRASEAAISVLLAVATLRTITTLDEGESPITPAVALVRQGRIALRNGDDKRARLCARRASMTDAEAEGAALRWRRELHEAIVRRADRKAEAAWLAHLELVCTRRNPKPLTSTLTLTLALALARALA